MENVSEIISLLGFIIFLVGVFNRSKPWGQRLLIIGGFCMALPHFYDVATGFGEGYLGNPRSE